MNSNWISRVGANFGTGKYWPNPSLKTARPVSVSFRISDQPPRRRDLRLCDPLLRVYRPNGCVPDLSASTGHSPLHLLNSSTPSDHYLSICLQILLPNPDRAGLHGTYLHPTTSQPDRPPSTSPSSPPPPPPPQPWRVVS